MRGLIGFLGLLMAGCGSGESPVQPPLPAGLHADPAARDFPPNALPGGQATVIELNPETDRNLHVLSRPSANLSPAGRSQFTVGNSFFTRPWVAAPVSTTARDGLGPLFNAAACQDCHVRDGRGHPPQGPDDALVAALVRIARADGSADPVYGQQLQPRAIPGVPAEARVRVHWEVSEYQMPDGTRIELRKPRVEASDWGYGEPERPLVMGLRVAPPMAGMGLLAAIPAEDLRAYSQLQRRESDGRIASMLRQVPDLASGELQIGRFGWRASQPTVRQQVVTAFANDMGITSSLIPQAGCTPVHIACRQTPQGGEAELQPLIEDAVVHYSRHLAVPARRDAERNEVVAGEALFHQIGCASCHRPSWRTGESARAPELADQLIWPYTDLLLHDMGEGLDDGLIEPGLANSRLWRTAPLWGLQHAQWVGGPKAGFLHDGRARNLTEAILWHGGSARHSREAWAALNRHERRLVLRFLASL